MDWFSVIVVYLIVWWTVIFAVLPLWVRIPSQPEPGHAASAPENPHLRVKIILTTLVSAIITMVIYLIVEADIFSFRDWASSL